MNTYPVGCGERSEPQRRGIPVAKHSAGGEPQRRALPIAKQPAGGEPQRRGIPNTKHFAGGEAQRSGFPATTSRESVAVWARTTVPRPRAFRSAATTMLRFALLTATFLLVTGCTETRFESPLGDNIESCDVHWKGLWLAPDSQTRERGEGAFLVDDECRFQMLDQTEPGTPFKRIHVPLNFVHDGGNDYLVIADVQLKGLVTLPAPYAISPTPEKSFFFARYRLRGERLEVHDVDSERVAKLILDAKLEGTIAKSATELHVYVRGNRQQMLEIVRTLPIFADKATVFTRSEQSVEAYEKSLLARQRKEKK